MKPLFFCLLVVFAVLTDAAPAAANPVTEITASGSGSVSLPPDMATINAAVETNADNADDAISQNNSRYERIVTALAREGIARSDITLSYYNISYNPRPQVMPPSGGAERYGYTVSRNFSVKVRKIGSAGRVSDASMAAGATAINGVTFGLANTATARGEATRKAVADARANAQAVAAAAGLHVTTIKSIDLGGAAAGPVPMMRAAAASAPTEFDQSNVNVTVSVTVVFLAGP